MRCELLHQRCATLRQSHRLLQQRCTQRQRHTCRRREMQVMQSVLNQSSAYLCKESVTPPLPLFQRRLGSR